MNHFSRSAAPAPAWEPLNKVRRDERIETLRVVAAWVALLAATCAGMVLAVVMAMALLSVLPSPPLVLGLVVGVPAVWLGTRALLWHRDDATRDLRRRTGQCLDCGYDLRGSRHAPRCPECGTRPEKR